MSIEFSEESLYVARNWQTVTDIIQAGQTLRTEMERELLAIGDDLSLRPWWDSGWSLVIRDAGQVFVSRADWRVGDQYFVWIGVERFRPESVFGLDDPAELYVWVAGKRYELASALADTLRDGDGPGEVDHKPGNAYVVRQAVAKCLPDAVEDYFTRAREQLLAFFDHYAAMADLWDPIVRRHVSE